MIFTERVAAERTLYLWEIELTGKWLDTIFACTPAQLALYSTCAIM